MKLQPCPKCGAQFDVSAFARGQQFTCGACGQVMTAHAASAAPAPAVSGRVPGSRSGAPVSASVASAGSRKPGAAAGAAVRGGPAAAPRGPQYQPVQRRQDPQVQAAAARPPRDREKPRRSRGERAEGGKERRRGSPAMIFLALGILVIVGVGLFLALGSSDKGKPTDTNPGGTPLAAPPPTTGAKEAAPTKDSVELVESDMKARPPRTVADFHRYASRLVALGTDEAKEAAREVYAELIKTTDPNDAEARKFLGFVEFTYELPEDIAFRRYPYMDAVLEFQRKHWLDDPDEIKMADEAKRQTEEHRRKLVEDQEFRMEDSVRAQIANDTHFGAYNYTARWARPYLICYSASDRMTPYEFYKITDREERKRLLKDFEEKRRAWDIILEEKAKVFQALYTEWMKRYAEPFGLKDLMAEWGGRPDYPQNVRSYRDGLPLIVWIFSDKEAFDKHHAQVKKDPIHPAIAGYFSPQTGWVYLFDNPEVDRQEELDKNVHEGTHQLQFWFTRQKNRWGKPHQSQSFFGEGIAEWIGSIKIDPARNVTFTGLNASRMEGASRNVKAFAEQKKEYPIYPLEHLTGFQSYDEADNFAQKTWSVPPMVGLFLFYEQAYSLVYFANEYKGGKYREKFLKFFEEVLNGVPIPEAFKVAFNIRTEDDWEDLDKAFVDFMRNDFLKRNPQDWKYDVPGRTEWPGK